MYQTSYLVIVHWKLIAIWFEAKEMIKQETIRLSEISLGTYKNIWSENLSDRKERTDYEKRKKDGRGDEYKKKRNKNKGSERWLMSRMKSLLYESRITWNLITTTERM